MEKNLNYNFKKVRKKSDRMGEGDFAGMPPEPIYRDYGQDPEYRQGVINSFTATLEKVSGIYENQRAK